jgi:hypothetical protein
MRRAAIAFAGILAVSIMAGCAGVPGWVVEGSGLRSGEASAIYGVGAAAPEADPEFQVSVARMNARVALVRIERGYVQDLLERFVEDHEQCFDREYAASVRLYEEAGNKVIDATRLGMEEMATWLDDDGRHMERGQLYALIVLPLDDTFFDAVQQEFKGLIRGYGAKLLTEELDTVLTRLDEALKHRRQDPLAEPPAPPEQKTEAPPIEDSESTPD